MNTTITTVHPTVVTHITAFCVRHLVNFTVNHTTDGLRIVHLNLVNPFLLTKLQDSMIGQFPAHAWDIHHIAA